MRHSRVILPALACLVVGVALYLTRAVLDIGLDGDVPVRLAFLPPAISLLGFVVLGGIGLLVLDHLNRPHGTTALERPRLGRLALPVFALVLLIVPFLPWLPDAWPALRLPAGPAQGVIWALVAGMLLWSTWHEGLWRLPTLDTQPLARLTAAVGLATFLFSGVAAARLTDTVLFPSGDEPHYLVIAQSLWRDGDFAIENNHAREDYREYFNRPLDPHYLTRGADGEIYSVHPVGLSILLAPIYALGGYHLVVIVLLALASLAAALMWRAIAEREGLAPATFAWAAVATSAPFALNAFTVYPELTAGLAAVVAFTLATGQRALDTPRLLGIGAAAGVLPWLSTKYAPMSAAIMAAAAARLWLPPLKLRPPSRDLVTATALLAAPYLACLAAWFAFFYVIWGSPWPQTPYGSMTQTTPFNLVFGAPGLLFDQEYGLLAYAPAYALAGTGLWALWRAGGERARLAIESGMVFLALLVTVGAFRIWWGGSASPSRPLGSGLLLLAPAVAAAYRAAGGATVRRAAQHLLLIIGVCFTAALTFAQQGLLIANDRDGTSRLLEYFSPRWDAWTLAPTFIAHEAGTAVLHVAAWLVIAAAAAWLIRRLRPATPGAAALMATTTLGGAVLAVAAVMPLLPDDPPLPRRDVGARSALDALADFDETALPTAVVYDPFSVEPASAAEPLLSLRVVPGSRTDPQPLRVLHNGRFSLPAGEYAVRVTWTDEFPSAVAGGAPFALQVGRIGPAFETWRVHPTAGGEWQATFSLPADAAFVGFRGSTDLERAIAAIRITPERVLDRAARPRTPPVLAAAQYPGAVVLFHDEQTYPEVDGFWTIGERTTEVTIVPPSDAPAILTMHSGLRPNHLVLEAHGWRQALDLAPGTPVHVKLPPPSRGVIELTITSESGFVPAEIEPGATDQRVLGAWVSVGTP
ncbi:MAG: hypothetical protein AB7O67_15980 [Vicinamibacterales bacterium]